MTQASQLDPSLPCQGLAGDGSKFNGYIPECKSRQELGPSPELGGAPGPTRGGCAGGVSPTAETQGSQIKMLQYFFPVGYKSFPIASFRKI